MRLQGRVLRPGDLRERRFFMSLGVDHVRVARGVNPFTVLRKIQRLVRDSERQMLAIRDLAHGRRPDPTGQHPSLLVLNDEQG